MYAILYNLTAVVIEFYVYPQMITRLPTQYLGTRDLTAIGTSVLVVPLRTIWSILGIMIIHIRITDKRWHSFEIHDVDSSQGGTIINIAIQWGPTIALGVR